MKVFFKCRGTLQLPEDVFCETNMQLIDSRAANAKVAPDSGNKDP
jgi:hypothetical protein